MTCPISNCLNHSMSPCTAALFVVRRLNTTTICCTSSASLCELHTLGRVCLCCCWWWVKISACVWTEGEGTPNGVACCYFSKSVGRVCWVQLLCALLCLCELLCEGTSAV